MSDKKDLRSSELEEMLKLGRSARAPQVTETEEDEAPTAALAQTPKAEEGFVLVSMKNNNGTLLSKPVMLCGCGAECDVFVPQSPENHSVSRKHCFIMLKYGKVYVKDTSLNGTYIGEPGTGRSGLARLIPDVETELRPGQVLSLADELYLLVFRKDG